MSSIHVDARTQHYPDLWPQLWGEYSDSTRRVSYVDFTTTTRQLRSYDPQLTSNTTDGFEIIFHLLYVKHCPAIHDPLCAFCFGEILSQLP